MKDLQEATIKICELKGENLSQLALPVLSGHCR